MQVKRRSSMAQVLAGLVVVIVALVIVAVSGGSQPGSSSGNSSTRISAGSSSTRTSATTGSAAPGRSLGSMFQDDPHLIFASTATVTRTLDILRGLGVNQIRATVVWKDIATGAFSTAAPRHFAATDPAAYPAIGWAAYDRLDELTRARGMTLNLNVTAPAPLWAVARGAPSPHYADHWMPSAVAFGRFFQALGTRYSGRYVPRGHRSALPRVSFWSIWNEPNQPGWLAPQWRSSSRGPVMEAPVLYRGYVDAAFAALTRTGHRPGSDTILVGDLAPEGCTAGVRCIYPRPEWPLPPLPFLRALYCVGPEYRPLSGASAAALGCPSSPDPRAFVVAHPALFQATGFAHHPYSFFAPPNVPLPEKAFAPLSNLGRLEQALDAVFRAYGVHRRLPIYLTEYGYETNPPNPIRGVSPQTQALYLNQAEYMAWSDPRVRTLNQFLLFDYPTNRTFSTFQTGLLYADGRPKPALSAYRLPIFLPHPVLGPGHAVYVWAMLREAPRGSAQRPDIQWRASSGDSFRTIQQVTVANRNEVLSATVRLPGAGQLRVQWISPTSRVQDSRVVSVRG
jgi:hypothetical protein